MATIGRRAAITQFRSGRVVRGTLGWLAWLGLHLVYLIGFRNKIVVFVNWSWRYLSWGSGPRIIVSEERVPGPDDDVARIRTDPEGSDRPGGDATVRGAGRPGPAGAAAVRWARGVRARTDRPYGDAALRAGRRLGLGRHPRPAGR